MEQLHQNKYECKSQGTREAIIVFTGAPVGIEFGIDCITYETGPKFRGLSMIPPGLHFLYYGTGMGARQGFFIRVENSQILVHTWDSANEQILPLHDLSDESLNSLYDAVNRGELNAELGPYPLHQHHLWKSNSCFVTDEVLLKAHCTQGTLLFPGDESDIFDKSDGQIERKQNESFNEIASTACFVDVKSVEAHLLESLPRGDPQELAAQLTSMMLDKSQLLEHLVCSEYSGSNTQLLGELQLSFMLFMLLYSYPGLQHWKTLVSTICCSEKYLSAHPVFAAAFMKTLYSQLSFSPADFFESELSRHNFLVPAISSLFSSLDGMRGQAENEGLQEHRKRLFLFLRKKFNLFDGFDSADQCCLDSLEAGSEDGPVFVSVEELRHIDGYDDTVVDSEGAVDVSLASKGGEDGLCAARWAAIDGLLQLPPSAPDAHHNLISISCGGSSSLAAPSFTAATAATALSPAQMEAAKFGWRYPVLFESMLASQGREDMTMAAMRVFEETADLRELSLGEPGVDALAVGSRRQLLELRAEALRFIENELSRL